MTLQTTFLQLTYLCVYFYEPPTLQPPPLESSFMSSSNVGRIELPNGRSFSRMVFGAMRLTQTQNPSVDHTLACIDACLAQGITTFDPWHLPLINTLILLLSGCAATWAHHALVHENNRRDLKQGLIIAVLLGMLFTFFQAYEYSHAAFGFAGNVYGASFFMATGFHGFHVIIGTIFLTVCLIRAIRGDFTPEKHIGFEAAAWYWHFVDVVWLFLFAAVYVWGQ